MRRALPRARRPERGADARRVEDGGATAAIQRDGRAAPKPALIGRSLSMCITLSSCIVCILVIGEYDWSVTVC